MTETTETETDVADLSATVAADEGTDESRVYELGYHLLPTLDESAVGAVAEKIAGVLKDAGAEAVGERAPNRIDLAYAIEYEVEGKRRSFNSAYFGWIAFEATASALSGIEAALKTDGSILRFLLIKTTRDAVESALADPSLDAGAPAPEPAGDELDEALESIEGKKEEKE
ncbi:MAG: 30S ribosomal protein S6 [Candidatus Paceibacteria bacterium]